MKEAALFLFLGGTLFFFSSCAPSDSTGSPTSTVRTSTTAYEIEQTNRYEADRRERDLSWR
ncbi:hypothetical protein [Haloferula sp.]|uniref:hypothetical protein n=1 Tax=Haloferula sp. TaxID=2497595 RepID=UPI003C730BA8